MPPLPFPTPATGNHLTPIRAGARAAIEGREYYAVGRFLYSQAGSRWEEWVLLTVDGDLAYLEFDEGTWTFSRPCRPASAPGAEYLLHVSAGAAHDVDGIAAVVVDAGPCRIAATDGEIPWPVPIGTAFRYVDFLAGQTFYSAELGHDGSVEWVRGRRMGADEVRAVFGEHMPPHAAQTIVGAELSSGEAAEASRWRTILARVSLTLGILSAILCLVNPGRIVATGVVPVNTLPAYGLRVGPFPLSATGRVYRLTISSRNIGPNDWVQGIVEDAQAATLATPNGPVSGSSESSLNGAESSSAEFRLDHPGYYYVRLLGSTSMAATATYEIREGVYATASLVSFAVFAIILAIWLFIRPARRRTWAEMAGR